MDDSVHWDSEVNQLLRKLPREDYELLRPSLDRVSLPTGTLLNEARTPIKHVYFPQQCVLSELVVMDDGATAEVETVGNEGMAGLSVFLGADQSPVKLIAQISDHAHRIAVPEFRTALRESSALRDVLSRYAQTVLAQVVQSAACNRLHSMEERCARWLLMTHDRVGGAPTFELKQEFLAYMLAVRRPTVTVAAGILQKAGLIHYSRGKITVTDRPRLEEAACECYQTIRNDYQRAMS